MVARQLSIGPAGQKLIRYAAGVADFELFGQPDCVKVSEALRMLQDDGWHLLPPVAATDSTNTHRNLVG